MPTVRGAHLGRNPEFFSSIATASTELYPLSLHDALPIWTLRAMARRFPRSHDGEPHSAQGAAALHGSALARGHAHTPLRSEEHTSELQSLAYLVCRLLLEKKNKDTVGWLVRRESYAPFRN